VTEMLTRAVKEAVVIAIVVIVVALTVNFTRDEGIPLIADADAFRIQTDAEFIVAGDAGAHFTEGSGIFVDAREPRLFEVEHIEGAMNVPSTPGNVDTLAYMVPADPVLICYSAEETERQAGVIADRLLEIGFKKVYVLHGGLDSWKETGLPTAGGN
jgi:rhodanese-related sulfurtransferase